jgi:hypothetical protein
VHLAQRVLIVCGPAEEFWGVELADIASDLGAVSEALGAIAGEEDETGDAPVVALVG